MTWKKFNQEGTFENETWKPCFEYPQYEVSDMGRVRRNGNIRSVVINPLSGYVEVALSNNGRMKRHRIHRLVYAAFNGKIPDGLHINHLNKVKHDNRLENLEAITPEANNIHAAKNNKHVGELVNTAKFTALQVLVIRERYEAGEQVPALAKEYGVNKSSMRRIVKRLAWKHI